MAWFDENDQHEGYLVPVFYDGQRGNGERGGVPKGRIAYGSPIAQGDGKRRYSSRPAGEVTAWQVCCDCHRQDEFRPTTWLGPQFTRVPSEAMEDLRGRRIYASDEDVAHVSDRDGVLEAAVDLWRSEHRFGEDALLEVAAAAAAFDQARTRLDAAVMMARAGGASWTKVGEAVGISRQAARERWHDQT